MSEPARLMKPGEVAEIYGVTSETVVDWAQSGRIAATRTPGGQWRIYAFAVDAPSAATP